MTHLQRSTGDLIAVLQQDAQNVADPDTFLRALTAKAATRSRARGARRWLLPALAAATVGVVAIAAVSIAAGHTRQRVAPAQPATADRNRQLTTAETIRLVDLVNLPPASSLTTVQPRSLNYPAGGILASTSLVDTVRYWRVPLSYSKAVAWMAAHPPAGLRITGWSGPTGSQKQFSGYIFDAPASGAWQQASLQIGILPSSPGSTFWRVDGMALWVDPAPVPDTFAGPRLHVSVAAGCPSSDQGVEDVSNFASGLAAALLPPESPASALLCVYSGGNGRAFALVSHRLLQLADARHLADLARAVSFGHVDTGPHGCPMDDGAAGVLAFGYPDGRDVALWFRRGGCGGVSNGTIVAGAFGNASVYALLAAIDAAAR